MPAFRLRRTDRGSTLRGNDTLRGGAGAMVASGVGVGTGTGTMTLTAGDMIASGVGVGTGRVLVGTQVTIIQPSPGQVSGVVEVQVEVLPFAPFYQVFLQVNNQLPLLPMERSSGPLGNVWTRDVDFGPLSGTIDLFALAAFTMGTISQDPISETIISAFTNDQAVIPSNVVQVTKDFAEMSASGVGVGTGTGSLFAVNDMVASGVGVGTGSGNMFAVVNLGDALGIGVGIGVVLVEDRYLGGFGVSVEGPDTVVPADPSDTIVVSGPDTVESDQERTLVEVSESG